MTRLALAACMMVVVAALAIAVSAPTAQAADVNVNLYAEGLAWHVGTNTSSNTRITANVGDTLRLRIENQDLNAGHTFTADHFAVNVNLGGAIGALTFVNITIDQGDVGEWQFWCIPHSSGTPRTGMVGSIVVPAPPSDNTVLIIGGVVIVVAIVAVAATMMMRRRKAPPQPPAQP